MLVDAMITDQANGCQGSAFTQTQLNFFQILESYFWKIEIYVDHTQIVVPL